MYQYFLAFIKATILCRYVKLNYELVLNFHKVKLLYFWYEFMQRKESFSSFFDKIRKENAITVEPSLVRGIDVGQFEA